MSNDAHTNETDSNKILQLFRSSAKDDLQDSVPDPGCDRDAEEYNMSHKARGLALIFNHNEIPGMSNRTGSDKDSKDLSSALKDLGFAVQVHQDLTYAELTRELTKAANEDHSQSDCILLCVMSHGDPGVLYSMDRPYLVRELWTRFTGDRCPSLAGKPKIFIIQACRGTKVDDGVVVTDSKRDQLDAYAMDYSIPVQADILIAYSTVEGFYSWRNPSKGSWFIQALCQELMLNGKKRDLMTLLTFTCRRVAVDYQSVVPKKSVEKPTSSRITEYKLPYLKVNSDGLVELKKECNYHYQIQSQLRVTKRQFCFFYVYTERWQLLLRINADSVFWREKMEEKLKRFYMECLLPELTKPRYGKRLNKDDIRDPKHIIQAQKERRKKNERKNSKFLESMSY